MPRKHQPARYLPVLSPARLRRLRARLPLEVLAAAAGVPLATLSRAERGEKPLHPDALRRVDDALAEIERRTGER